MSSFKICAAVLAGTAIAMSETSARADLTTGNPNSGQSLISGAQPAQVWQGQAGDGFRSSVRTFSLEAGATGGFAALGGREEHDLALVSLAYGHMWGKPVGEDHWYGGNWEIRGELFGGEQFSPSRDWLIGLTPHLRYNFSTGTRLTPFVDLGAGVTATQIGAPDLSGNFEFNLQANTGVHYFIRNNLALTFEAGYLHVSCAGIHRPNLGLNCVKGMVGVTWFF
jgi:hypothetical protein